MLMLGMTFVSGMATIGVRRYEEFRLSLLAIVTFLFPSFLARKVLPCLSFGPGSMASIYQSSKCR